MNSVLLRNAVLKKYSRLLKKKLACEAIMTDMHRDVMKVLNKCKDGQAIVDSVEYHLTTKVTKHYPDDVNDKIKKLRSDAEELNRVKESSKETFDSYIPKSVKKPVLAGAVPEYKKHFSVNVSIFF